MRLASANWNRILTILLVILASLALLYVLGQVLLRFKQALLLFTLGTILAYILSPLVNRLEAVVHRRWLAIFASYALVTVGLFALGVLLFTPFIQQSQSLVDNLHNPSSGSLQRIADVQGESDTIVVELQSQERTVSHGGKLEPLQVKTTEQQITAFDQDVNRLYGNKVSSPSHIHVQHVPPGKVPANPEPQTEVPRSYVKQIARPANRLVSVYSHVQAASPSPGLLKQAVTQAERASQAAHAMYHTMSTTPILLIRSQAWLDRQGIPVDLASKFGEAAGQVSNQGTTILNNAITILSEAANALINGTLILIIAFYLLSDGGRMVHSLQSLLPQDYRDQGHFFLESLDRVLGGYIRGQLALSLLAGVLGGGGAAILGVPYPLLIGIVTFLLESVPVIGPIVAVVPALIIALFFNGVGTAIVMFVWFTLFQQVVTNILGPRVMGAAVGIHPLEALFAVLVGYPIGGFLGAFLAVPIMGIIHILIREAYAYFVLGQTAPEPAVPLAGAISRRRVVSAFRRSRTP